MNHIIWYRLNHIPYSLYGRLYPLRYIPISYGDSLVLFENNLRKEVEDVFDCTSQCAEKQWCEILIGGLEQYQMEMFSVYIFTIILYDIHKVF